MKVKIDTKAKFHVIRILEPRIAANMTAALREQLLGLLHTDVKNVVLSLKDTEIMDKAAARALSETQQVFHEGRASLVICEITPSLQKLLSADELPFPLNLVPTESEASDLVLMEEIERELLE